MIIKTTSGDDFLNRLFSYNKDGLYAHRTLTVKPENEDFSVHAHDMFEIFYFISGECKFVVEGNEYNLNPGDILVMRPAETHDLRIMSDKAYERISVHIPFSFFEKFDTDSLLIKPFYERPLGFLNKYTQENFDSNLYKTAIETIKEGDDEIDKTEIESRLYLILSEIYKAYKKREREIVSHVKKDDLSIKLIDYITRNLYSDLSLKSISNEFYISVSQINRIFKKATGSTVSKYIKTKRLISAREQIRAGKPACKVSADCGFGDYSSFYRMYTSQFGVSPNIDLKTR